MADFDTKAVSKIDNSTTYLFKFLVLYGIFANFQPMSAATGRASKEEIILAAK